MKNILFLLLFPIILFSQVNFSEDISPIIYNNCTECHRDGGAGPMSFSSYEEVASLGMMIQYVTESGYMPPWHADPEYSTFLGERVLTNQEKQLIAVWVAADMPQGDPSLEAEIPNFPEGSVIGEPDVIFTMEEEYLIEGNNQDDYRVFVFSTNFSEEKELKSIEFIPGNPSAVHHVLINIDTEGECATLDDDTPEYGYECASGFCTGSVPFLATGYVPGMVPPVWNNDVGLKLPVGADIAIQVHYAPSSIDQYDQSSINLFFKNQPIEREVEVFTLIDVQIQIPANEIYTNYKSFNVSEDISLLSILPHSHLIGKSWLIYAENDGDTIPIISIPDWDFNWQNFYQPEYMLKIPQGYTIHAYAIYDNTENNPSNPNDPPEDMFWCDYTTCEMFFVPFAYVLYEEGDEYIYIGNPILGCTIESACNYNMDATENDGSCEYPPDWYDCDGNCLSDADGDGICDQFEIFGCMNPEACNYDEIATEDDGNCEYPLQYYDCNGDCLNDADADGICDETECFTVLCQEFYECVLGDCICVNDADGDGICDENEADCLSLNILSINQINPDQFNIVVENSSWDNIFSYPGFILFNSFGDTIAIETVDYYGIAGESTHTLQGVEFLGPITESISLQLYTGFYEDLVCEWNDLYLSDNCDLYPNAGECLAYIETYYFNQITGLCELTFWGGCAGIVPYWTLEECENDCGSIFVPEFIVDKKLIRKLDFLGRDISLEEKGVIRLYDDGSVEKEFIFSR